MLAARRELMHPCNSPCCAMVASVTINGFIRRALRSISATRDKDPVPLMISGGGWGRILTKMPATYRFNNQMNFALLNLAFATNARASSNTKGAINALLIARASELAPMIAVIQIGMTYTVVSRRMQIWVGQ
mmetsp:Transcript_7368/g.13596  ORF Transcript_7368/g.13596 Transcript_7368/m.13596 type:complete len:132 (-) Transcript_7368:4-399(-)